MPASSILQTGLPPVFTDLLSLAGSVVLILLIVALGAFVYKHLTGGIEWPEDAEDDDGLRRGDQDDEWDYY